MADIVKIIKAIDEFLENKHPKTTTPVEVNPYLERKGLLNDSLSRPGKPLREILRKGLIPHAYQIGVNWFIPHSGKKLQNPKTIVTYKLEKEQIISNITPNGHKLSALGELVVELLEKKYKKKPVCFYEYKPDWLLSNPSNSLIEKYPIIKELYARLVDNKFDLINKLLELTNKQLKQTQSFDIWIGEPFNFAIEFDEKQHFNQFRKITLNFYENLKVRFPVDFYKSLNKDAVIKPGTSGFAKLKSKDPLFPEMLSGENQDNRIRQRAFRDFLKDLLPIENGYNPTLRIPYHLTNKKITDFTNSDLQNVRVYIFKNISL